MYGKYDRNVGNVKTKSYKEYCTRTDDGVKTKLS